MGDIDSERQRLLAEADAQAAALLADGRARLDAEVAEMEQKAEADIAAAAGRTADELRNEIARLAAAAADRVVERSLDDATQQRLRSRTTSRVESEQQRGPGSASVNANNDAVIDGYARGLFEVARAEGTLDEVEDELFRFARSYESSEELRNTLSDDQIRPASVRRSSRTSSVAGPRRRRAARLDGDRLGPQPRPAGDHRPHGPARRQLQGPRRRRGAQRVPLTADQQERLKAALANATGKNVDLKVIVDPSVIGGLVATVGDTVIDGTVRTHLDQLKSRL